MKRRLLLTASIAVLLLLGAMAAACGGGDDAAGPTSEEYFQQVEGAVGTIDQRVDALASEWEEKIAAGGADQDDLELMRDFYYELFDLIGDFRDDLADIQPAEEVEEAHDNMVAAAEEFANVWSEISADFKAAASEAELEEIMTSDRFVEVGEQFDKACTELQRIADDKEIDVNLQCED